MSKYLFIESRDPFESPDVKQQWNLATELASRGNEVTMFLVQNGVFAARRTAKTSTLDASAGIAVLADDLSLAERGIRTESLRDNVKLSSIDALTDLIMEDGCKPIWT
jgi:predicted peroxiredoxin